MPLIGALLRVGRLPELVTAASVSAVVGAIGHGAWAPFPSLSGRASTLVPMIAFVGLVPAAGVVRSMQALPDPAGASAVRRLGRYRAVGTLIAVLVPAAGVAIAAGPDAGLAMGRDVAGLVGLALCGLWAAGPSAAVLGPLSYLMAAFLFGHSQGTCVRWWAWPMAAGGGTHLVIPAGFLAAGLTTCWSLSERAVRRGRG